jgi:hypothetical protein
MPLPQGRGHAIQFGDQITREMESKSILAHLGASNRVAG